MTLDVLVQDSHATAESELVAAQEGGWDLLDSQQRGVVCGAVAEQVRLLPGLDVQNEAHLDAVRKGVMLAICTCFGADRTEMAVLYGDSVRTALRSDTHSMD